MPYVVKEIFRSLCGEGYHAGRVASFVRFAGCNLGYGVCPFCDTDWIGGTRYDLADLVAAIPPGDWCVLTGGEPALQIDAPLVDALHAAGFGVQIETNGTLSIPQGIDWVTMSPKAGSQLGLFCGDELKLVYPQAGVDPEDFYGLYFTHRYLQPMDGPDLAANTRAAVDYCLAHPSWRVSLQIHKLLGLR